MPNLAGEGAAGGGGALGAEAEDGEEATSSTLCSPHWCAADASPFSSSDELKQFINLKSEENYPMQLVVILIMFSMNWSTA